MIPWEQSVEMIERGRGGQEAQDIAQPEKRLEAIGFGGLDQGIDDGAGVSAGRRVGEEPSLPADDKGTDGVLGGIVVDGEIAAFDVADQTRPLVVEIAQGLAESGARRDGRPNGVQPKPKGVEHGSEPVNFLESA